MESDPNPMPQLDLFPRVTKVVDFLLGHLHEESSDHNTGGGPMLDRELYDNPNQLELDYGRNEQTI